MLIPRILWGWRRDGLVEQPLRQRKREAARNPELEGCLRPAMNEDVDMMDRRFRRPAGRKGAPREVEEHGGLEDGGGTLAFELQNCAPMRQVRDCRVAGRECGLDARGQIALVAGD